MDKASYTIERARLRAIESMRAQAIKDGETDRVYDLSCEVKVSMSRLQYILGTAYSQQGSTVD